MRFRHCLAMAIVAWVVHVFADAIVCAEELPKAKYKMPALMMVTWAEWPKEPAQQDVMAQFIRSQGFNAVEVEIDKLEMCRRNGLYARLGSGDINAMLKDAARLKDDKTVFAYFISDRRRKTSFPGFAQVVRDYKKADPNHPTMFINRANWNEYPEFVKQVQPRLLDFYHYHWDGRRNPDRRYIYLSEFRELGQRSGIPVMRCVDGSESLPKLRQTIYTSLAYGIQGFHFFPPWLYSLSNIDGKPIFKDGKIVPRVNLPQMAVVAKEIEPLGPVLIKLRSTAVYHTPPVHPAAPGAVAVPKEFWVQPVVEQLLIGMFEDDKKNDYLMVVNCDVSEERNAALRFAADVSSVELMDKKTGKWVICNLEKGDAFSEFKYNLLPGNGELLRVVRSKNEK